MCSEEAWEIMMMLIPSRARTEKTRAAKPGMPIMPPPSMFTREIPSMEAMPVMGRSGVAPDEVSRGDQRSRGARD